jgi:hypothetical protein
MMQNASNKVKASADNSGSATPAAEALSRMASVLFFAHSVLFCSQFLRFGAVK